MLSMVAWMIGLGASVAVLVIAAAAKLHLVHAALCAGIALAIALLSARELRFAQEAGEPRAYIAAHSARHMGLVWAWGAIVIIVTYTSVLIWKEWWHFALAFIILAGLCLFFSASLKNEQEGAEDSGMLSLSRYLAIGQFAATVVTIVGLSVFDGRTFKIGGKMLRYLQGHPDWAANNVFLFGAVALAAISWMAIQATREN